MRQNTPPDLNDERIAMMHWPRCFQAESADAALATAAILSDTRSDGRSRSISIPTTGRCLQAH